MEMRLLLALLIFSQFLPELCCAQLNAYPPDCCGVKDAAVKHKLFEMREAISYDKKGRVIYTSNNSTSKRFIYYQNHSIDSMVCISDTSIYVEKFDLTGKLIMDSYQSGLGRTAIERFYEYDSLGRMRTVKIPFSKREVTFHYSDATQKFCVSEKVFVNGMPYEEIVFERDFRGNPTLTVFYWFNENHEKYIDNRQIGGFVCSPCRYEYDAKGNWVRKYIKAGNKEKLYAVRKISYY